MREGVHGAASLLLLLLVTLSQWLPALAKYDSGKVETDEKWVFLTKFCFLATKGQINYHIRYPQAKHNVNLLFYHDEKSQWPSVYKNRSKDCWSKEAVAAIEKNQLFNLTQSFPLSGCQVMEENGINYTDCQRGLGFKSTRERWWFLAVSNCMGGGICLDYEITMTNGNALWRRHFSANQIGIFEVNMLSIILFIILFGISIYFSRQLKKRSLLHSSYQMLMVSMGTEVLGRFFLCVHFGIYAYNGVGCESAKVIGRLLHVISYLLLVPMLLLISHGFTITRAKIDHSSAVAVCLLTVMFSLLYTWFFIDENHLMDPGKVQTGLESPFGFAVTALQFLTAFWFSYSTYGILQQHPEKQPFYSHFFPAFTFWFFVVPFSNILGQFIIVPWKRERIMNTVFLFLKFYAYVVMLLQARFYLQFLVRPFHSNSRFPYHIDTSRIALMRHGSDSQGNFEKLGHHLYRNISVTSFINNDSTAPSLNDNTDLSQCTTLMEGSDDVVRDLLERNTSQIDTRFGFMKKPEASLQLY